MTMKTAAVAASLLLAAACSSDGGGADKPPDLVKLELKLEQYQTKALSTHSILTDRVIALERKTDAQKNLIDVLEVDVKRLRSEVEAFRAAAGSSPTPTPAVRQPDATSPPPSKVEDAMARTEAALNELKKGTSEEQVANDLKPVADLASARLVEALGTNATDPKLTAAIEGVLAKLPPKSIEEPLKTALADRLRRGSAVRVIGAVRDLGLSKVLEAHTADADDDFCVLVGSAMLFCKNRYGVPALFRGLKSKHKDTRFLALTTLRMVNRDALGYDYNLTPEQNSFAIKKWEEWWDANGPKLFE